MSYREDIRNYLIKERGIHLDKVDELLTKGMAEIVSGRKLESLPYYPGDQIVNKYATEDDFDPDFEPPALDDESEDDK